MPEIIVETDFHRWTEDTAEAIKKREFGSVDWDRVAEEIDSLGKSEEHQLQSRLAQLMYHLLKIQHQPERHSRSWERSVVDQKKAILQLLQKQPSLKSVIADAEFWEAAYLDVSPLAASDNLPDSVVDRFPERCPFDLGILD